MTDRITKKTLPPAEKFDTATKMKDAIPGDRRGGQDQRDRGDGASAAKVTISGPDPTERRIKKERRRRIDPTTFEKQYTDDEIEFMNAMQRFKMQSGRSFPTCGEILEVAQKLGYRKNLAQKLCQVIDGHTPFSGIPGHSGPKMT